MVPGGDHAGSLGHSADNTVALPSFTVRRRELSEKVSVVMNGFAASSIARRGIFGQRAAQRCILVASRFADHRRSDSKTPHGAAHEALSSIVGGSLGRLPPGLAGEGIGFSEYHHHLPAEPSLEDLPPSFWRGTIPPEPRTFRLGETPARWCPVMTASSTSVRPDRISVARCKTSRPTSRPSWLRSGRAGKTGVDIGKNPKTRRIKLDSSRPGRSPKRVFAQIVSAIHVAHLSSRV